MSIPGLGISAHAARPPAPIPGNTIIAGPPVIHDISANSEWRFQVAIGTSIDVKILSGTAELFGTELALNHTYTFRGTKAAIFTWHGCKIEVTGECKDEYTAAETPMVQYVNTHFALDKLRDDASSTRGGIAPRVLVVGPNHSGKTSFVKLLAAYAIRMGRQPMIINTDPTESILSVPGTLTATPLASILDVEEGWGSSPSSGPSPVPAKLPLCYYYGLPSPEDNPKLYKAAVSRLAIAALGRLEVDPEIKSTGMIIDSSGAIIQGKNNFDIITHLVSEFQVDTLLVLESERLHSDMTRRFQSYKTPRNTSITIIKLDKSGANAEPRDEQFLRHLRDAAVKEYFFGSPRRTLSPTTTTIYAAALTVYRIAGPSTGSASFLPGDVDHDAESPLYERVEMSMEMMHCVFAVVYATAQDSLEVIRDACVMGFVYVSEVDEAKKKCKVLAPLGVGLEGRVMVWGSMPGMVGSLMG